MNIIGPSPIALGTLPSAEVHVAFDFHTMTVTVGYGDAAHTKTVTRAIPAALLAALQAHMQATIEANEGWAPGSSTVTS